MIRESCISHRPRQPIAVVREDYYQLMDRDCVAAALLNIFEYWANAAIATNPDEQNPWVGARPVKEFEGLLLGIATDKQIRKRLHEIKERGFIETKQSCPHRKTLEYRFMCDRVQSALNEINGQMTAEDPEVNGQTTADPTVKQPLTQRSNDRRKTESQRSNDRFSIYKNSSLKEEVYEEGSADVLELIHTRDGYLQEDGGAKQEVALNQLDGPVNQEMNSGSKPKDLVRETKWRNSSEKENYQLDTNSETCDRHYTNQGTLPFWRDGRGSNGIKQEASEWLLTLWQLQSPNKKFFAANAKSYIARRENPTHPEYGCMIELLEEGRKLWDHKQAKIANPVYDYVPPVPTAPAISLEEMQRGVQIAKLAMQRAKQRLQQEAIA